MTEYPCESQYAFLQRQAKQSYLAGIVRLSACAKQKSVSSRAD